MLSFIHNTSSFVAIDVLYTCGSMHDNMNYRNVVQTAWDVVLQKGVTIESISRSMFYTARRWAIGGRDDRLSTDCS